MAQSYDNTVCYRSGRKRPRTNVAVAYRKHPAKSDLRLPVIIRGSLNRRHW